MPSRLEPYIERERRRAVAWRAAVTGDPGGGRFLGSPRPFVLADPDLNLWEGLRVDAKAYFASQAIAWWNASGGAGAPGPTGHLLSSQVACVNHLFPLRQRPDAATALLRALDPEVVAAEPIEADGLVAFEFIGPTQRLAERAFLRGSQCTSVDAAMIGRLADGRRRLVLIEWKYVETYASRDKYAEARAKVYDALIRDPASPFQEVDPSALYVEPFYQMMRQTLLGWLIARAGDLGCTSFAHVHVVPEANREFHDRVTAPRLKGETVSEAWRAVLREPSRYVPVTPEALMAPVAACADTGSHLGYLRARYGEAARP